MLCRECRKKTAEPIKMPFRLRFEWSQGTTYGNGQFLGENGRPVIKYIDSAVSCEKTAEPIAMLFGIWNRVGPRKHVLSGGAH